MRKLPVLIARPAGRDRLHRPDGGCELRLEPPRGPADLARPHGRRHRRLRVRRARRAGRADAGRQLDPVRGSGRRAELLPVRRPRGLLHQRRQHRRRRRDVRYRFKFRRRPATRTRSSTRCRASTSISTRSSTSCRRTRSRASATSAAAWSSSQAARAATCPSRRTTSGRRRSPNYDAVANEAIKRCRGGGKVFAGPVDDPFFVDLGTTFDAINIRKGTGNAGRRQGRPRGLQRPHDRPAGAQGARSRATASAVAGAERRQRGRRRLVDHEPPAVPGQPSPVANALVQGASAGTRRRLARGEAQVSRLGNPLVNEVIIPLGQKDMFNATQPPDDAENFGKYVLVAGAGEGHQHPVPGPERAGDRPYGHRHGAADRAFPG